MDPIEPQDGPGPRGGRPSEATRAEAQARLDRRAEALRANLRRRKAQVRGRADAERDAPPD